MEEHVSQATLPPSVERLDDYGPRSSASAICLATCSNGKQDKERGGSESDFMRVTPSFLIGCQAAYGPSRASRTRDTTIIPGGGSFLDYLSRRPRSKPACDSKAEDAWEYVLSLVVPGGSRYAFLRVYANPSCSGVDSQMKLRQSLRSICLAGRRTRRPSEKLSPTSFALLQPTM